ncbi:Nucleoporin-like protein 2 [Grifola frondosa]|uniref:Nucleoporin-like protein 2 n=1 Tax=Grifola frondosa TaxID=5627 RepID=A0A1C7M1M3_GRIFR|nr:Nucleoporin-like protein 2 [Grifola frondosa]
MPVCQYFLRGQCKFGTSCRNDHPRDAQRAGGFGNQSWTAGNSAAGSSSSSSLFTIDSLTRDLDVDRPAWPLSSYGPAKFEVNLIPNLDESPEELRVKAVQAAQSGTIQEYLRYESEKISAAQQLFNNARSNIPQLHNQAIRNMEGKSHSGPSAFASTSSAFGGGGSAFGAPANTSVFGKPSGFGALDSASGAPRSAFAPSGTPSSAFGQPAFGQPAFGQSAFGKPAGTSAFGQPAQGTSVFGQPAQGTPTSAFGQPAQTSALRPACAADVGLRTGRYFFRVWQPAQPTSAFGSAAQSTSAFGQAAQRTSAFGQPSFGQTSAFGKPATSAFGAPSPSGGAFSAFADRSISTAGSGGGGGGGAFSAFAGTPSAFGLAAAANAPLSASTGPGFGQSSFGGGGSAGTSSVFGGSPSAPPAFGATSAFGALAPQPATTSVFGTPAAAPVTSAFGAPAGGSGAFGAPGNVQSAFGAPTQPVSAFGTPQAQTQPVSAFANIRVWGPQAQIQPTSAFGTMQAQTQPTSAFGSAAPQSAFAEQPISAFAVTSETPAVPKEHSARPDFEAALSRVYYKPGLNKYDAMLPENYMELLPASALEAFKSEKFEMFGDLGVRALRFGISCVACMIFVRMGWC